MCRIRLTLAALLTVAFTSLNLAVCQEKKATGQEAKVQKRAEALLEILRAGQWDKAVPLAITATGKHDQEMRRRLEIPEGATAELVGEKVGAWFELMYGSVRPGSVRSVRVLGPDEDYATVYYRHEDLDAFSMRLVEGEWYYTLDSEAPPKLSKAEVGKRATTQRDEWIARHKPEESDVLKRSLIESIERTKEGWHVAFVTRTGEDEPEGGHDYFLHVYLAEDGSLIKVVRGPDRLS